jgi:hypothetical protein
LSHPGNKRATKSETNANDVLVCIVEMWNGFLAERKAHPPLGARAEVSHGVNVVITGNHVKRTAPSGWMVRLVLLIF